ncbi:hypothetical protein F2Q69_00005642 [Brassica cretica]|uniref:Uncharacterized protein n=1 Tax=Brassica cretica TaxID=69181 RepID=A0A8S9P3Y6_BRACR|nr:hypothetical protein F2Q69_00005642 [Brassica cretica]
MHVFDQASSCYDRWGKAIDRGFYTDGAFPRALLDGDGALLDGDEAVSRWRRSSLTVALLESQTGKASVVSCYNVLAMEQNNWICLLRGSTKQEEGTSKQWTAKQSNTGVMARMMVR